MMAAIAQMEAIGNGLPDNASPGQTEDYLDRVRNHARIIIASQALAGFFTPGPASQLTVEHEKLLGLGVDDIQGRMAAEFQTLVKNMGIEQGTIEYLSRHETADMETTFNALAYTVGKARSVSGAPLPATEDALSFYDTNKDFFDANPYASPWLLPTPADTKDRSQYAYDSQVINGLRIRQTPDDFLNSVKMKRGAAWYFQVRDKYIAKRDMFISAGDDAAARQLTANFDSWAAGFKATHPIFRDQLESSDARVRRRRVIDEMRVVVNDPATPETPLSPKMRKMMTVWDRYLTMRAQLAEDGSRKGQQAMEEFKTRFETGIDAWVQTDPQLSTFWVTILRPEAGLD
jgi:hypothetical protein